MMTILPPPELGGRVTGRRTSPGSVAPDKPDFRRDIEGLRAIAVLFVLAFHAHVPGFGGGFVGVDVFFVISGYLITGQLFREVSETGRLNVGAFYGRRARRIIPPAALVMGVTGLVAWISMPPLALFRLTKDLLASLLYVANWNFIAEGKDYLAGSTSESPVLHMWSLAVEEQFYLVWPFLVLAAAYLSMRRGRSVRLGVGLALALVSVTSFGIGLVLTSTDPGLAYMATYTRAWQFGLGAMIAVVLPMGVAGAGDMGVRRAWATAIGASGLLLLGLSLVFISEATAYPGVAALLPTLGAGAIIAAGSCGPTHGLLSVPALRLVGKWSYAWYLWHWPALIFAEQAIGHLSWQQRVGVTTAAGLLAAATFYLLEQPAQRARVFRQRAASAGALGALSTTLALSLTLGMGAATANSLGLQVSTVDGATFAQVFGAASLKNSGPVNPSPINASGDIPQRPECLVDAGSTSPTDCVFGRVGGRKVVLFGDSHAHQWQPALQQIATEKGWELTVIAKSGCPVADIAPRAGTQARYSRPDCKAWRELQIDRIRRMNPSLIVFSGLNYYIPQYAEMLDSWRSSLGRLTTLGASLVYIRDTPIVTPGNDIPECVSASLGDWKACEFPNMERQDPVIDLVQRGELPDVDVVDLNGYLCDAPRCPAVRNGTLLYRDASHLTGTVVRLLEPAMALALVRAGVMPATAAP